MLAIAALCLSGMSATAQNEVGTAPVKMTYIDQSFPDSINGLCDTIRAGFNKAPGVGGTIGFGNTSWGENKIGVLKVDVSAIPGTVQKATLKAKISGSSDSKRTTGWGVALTDNVWAADLTYATAGSWTVSALLNGGAQVWTSTKAATVFEEKEWDITEALSGGQASATLLVYETAAAGGYMTEAYAEIEYEPYEATTTKYDFEDGNLVFTNDSRISSAIEPDATLNSNVLGWTCAGNAQNGYSFSHFDFTSLLNQPALVKVELDYYNTKGGRSILSIGDALVRGTTGGSSKVTYNSTGVIFRIGSDKSNAFINGTTLKQEDVTEEQDILDEEGNPTGEKQTVVTAYGICDKWLHITLMVNNDAKTVAWTVADQDGNVLYSGNDAFYASDANECSQIDIFGYINNSHCAMLDNLEITNYKSNAVFADYTIKYVDAEGNEIKASRTGNGQAGKFVTLLDSDKAAVYAEDNSMKYIYDSDDSETVAIAEDGSAVITVKFRNAEKYYAVLNCVIEGQTMTTGKLAQFRDNNTHWFWEGDTYKLYPARGYKFDGDGKYYFTAATSYNGTTFSFPGSVSPVKQGTNTFYIGTLYYSLVDSVAYYSDFERLALPVVDAGNGTGLGQLVGTVNSWWSFSGGYFDRFSGARGIRLDVDSYVYTEPIAEEGTYKVTIYGRNDKSAANDNPYQLGYILGEESFMYDELTIASWGSATTGANVVEGVSIPAGAKLMIWNTNADGQISLDDISLTKTGDYVAPVVTAINTISENVQPASNAIFNLAGQQVRTTQRGLYIVNGRKVVIK